MGMPWVSTMGLKGWKSPVHTGFTAEKIIISSANRWLIVELGYQANLYSELIGSKSHAYLYLAARILSVTTRDSPTCTQQRSKIELPKYINIHVENINVHATNP